MIYSATKGVAGGPPGGKGSYEKPHYALAARPAGSATDEAEDAGEVEETEQAAQ
jgi:hypothetical protein